MEGCVLAGDGGLRRQLNDALIEGYGQAIENLQATLEATRDAEKPSPDRRPERKCRKGQDAAGKARACQE